MDIKKKILNTHDDLINELERGELNINEFNKYKSLTDNQFLSFFLNKKKSDDYLAKKNSYNDFLYSSLSSESSLSNSFDNNMCDYSLDPTECFTWELEELNNTSKNLNNNLSTSDEIAVQNDYDYEYDNYIILKQSPN